MTRQSRTWWLLPTSLHAFTKSTELRGATNFMLAFSELIAAAAFAAAAAAAEEPPPPEPLRAIVLAAAGSTEG